MKLSSAILAAGFAAFSSHLAAEEVFVTAVGMKQGPFAGEISTKGFEGKVRAVGFSHEVLTSLGNRVARKYVAPGNTA